MRKNSKWRMIGLPVLLLGLALFVASSAVAQEPAPGTPDTVVRPPPADPLPKAEVSIEGPEKVALGQMAPFTLKGLDPKYYPSFDWLVFGKPADATVLYFADWRTGSPVLVFQSFTPGKCAIIADVNVEPLSGCQLIIHEFTVGKGIPLPLPAKDLFGIIVQESSDRIQKRDGKDVNFGPVLLSSKVSGLFKEGRFYMIDPDGKQVPAELKVYLDRAKSDSRQLPWLYLMNEKGEVLYDGPLPADVGKAVELIGKYKAKGKSDD